MGYLKTCDSQQPFLGSLEVFSLNAFAKILINLESCKGSLPWSSMSEHHFAARCMYLHNVRSIDAVSLALDGACAAKQGKKTALDNGANRRLGIAEGASSAGAGMAS